MLENLENIHKQIASFIVLSTALAIPSQAENISGSGELIADASVNMNTPIHIQEVMVFYGAPQLPPLQITPSEPIVGPGNIALYAAPQIPIQPINMPVVPIAEPASVMPIPTPALNESSLNVNYTVKAGIQDGSNNVDTNVKKDVNINKTNINANTNGFINTEFGNVRIIEPFAHFVFK